MQHSGLERIWEGNSKVDAQVFPLSEGLINS